MNDLKNVIRRAYRFPDKTPAELGEAPVLSEAFQLEARWYDAGGKMVKREDYDADGTVNEADHYVFNEKGLISEHSHFMAGERTETTKITYLETGQPLKEEKIFAEGGKQVTSYEYDGDGHLLRKGILDEDGQEEGYEIQEWENGNVVRRSVRDLLMETGDDYEMKYVLEDEKWTLREEIHTEVPAGVMYRTIYSTSGYVTYDKNGSRFSSHKKEYDEKGRLAASHYSTMQRDVSSFYSYDEQDKLKEERRTLGDLENYRAAFFYDEKGELKMAHVTEASSGTFTDVYLTEPVQES